MSHKTAITVAHTIGIDPGKNTLHLIGLDDKGAIVLRALGCGSRLRRDAYIIMSWQLRSPISWRGSLGQCWHKVAATKRASSQKSHKIQRIRTRRGNVQG